MKRPFVLVIPAIILAGIVLFGLSDTSFSIVDTSIPDNEVASRRSEANNASATATITIMMYSSPNEQAS